jgi:hypothetical protein
LGREIGTSSFLESSVPVTAKLSKKFYEKFGEDVTNELVNWFNSVDTTYRADLRELNEANFQRFDAKMGERLAEVDGKWGVRWTELDAKLADRLGQVKSDLLKWMLTFWVSTLIGLGALFFRS